MRSRLVQLGYLRPDGDGFDESSLKAAKLGIDLESVTDGDRPGPARKKAGKPTTVIVRALSAADKDAKAMKRLQDFVSR